MRKFALIALVLAACSQSMADACRSREALVQARVQSAVYTLENAHDPVCLLSLRVGSVRQNVTCPLMIGDLPKVTAVETNYRYSEEACRAIPTQITGVISLPVDSEERGTIEIFESSERR